MKKIESKTWKISQKKLDEEIAIRNHFGWEFVSNTTNGSGNAITLTMKRDPQNVHHRRFCRLQFQAEVISRKFPISSLVWAGIGGVCLIPYFCLKSNPWFASFLALALFCFAVALFILMVYLFTFKKKKSMLQELYDEGDELQGKLKVNPLPENTLKPGKETYHLKRYIYGLGKKVKAPAPVKKEAK